MVAVRFGAGTLIGPAVQIYTADHPPDPLVRRSGAEFGRLIAIGRDVWIGSGAVVIELFVLGLGAEHVGRLIQTRAIGVQGIGRETRIGAGVRPTLLLEGLGDTR
jgi:maltose O-acetyltransferase